MGVREVRASGLEYLALTTQLLRRARLADPAAGLWEAADLQWWWRRPRDSDAVEQVFWIDDDGPVAGVALIGSGEEAWECVPIVVPGDATVALSLVWARAMDVVDSLGLAAVDVLVRDDDAELIALATGSGFAAGPGEGGMAWMDAGARPAAAAVPDGFALVDRSGEPTKPHPMRGRNGDGVEARLRQCSLYDPALDLAVETTDGEPAGYALFWFDAVTEVGLLEPMRVEDDHQRRGLARALLGAGIGRLVERGARRLKVGYSTDIARALYTGAGFQTTSTDTSYTRRKPAG